MCSLCNVSTMIVCRNTIVSSVLVRVFYGDAWSNLQMGVVVWWGSWLNNNVPKPNEGVALRYSLAHATVKPGETIHAHRLKSSEVYYVLQGDGEMYLDGKKEKLRTGHVIYIPPNSVQRIKKTLVLMSWNFSVSLTRHGGWKMKNSSNYSGAQNSIMQPRYTENAGPGTQHEPNGNITAEYCRGTRRMMSLCEPPRPQRLFFMPKRIESQSGDQSTYLSSYELEELAE